MTNFNKHHQTLPPLSTVTIRRCHHAKIPPQIARHLDMLKRNEAEPGIVVNIEGATRLEFHFFGVGG